MILFRNPLPVKQPRVSSLLSRFFAPITMLSKRLIWCVSTRLPSSRLFPINKISFNRPVIPWFSILHKIPAHVRPVSIWSMARDLSVIWLSDAISEMRGVRILGHGCLFKFLASSTASALWIASTPSLLLFLMSNSRIVSPKLLEGRQQHALRVFTCNW